MNNAEQRKQQPQESGFICAEYFALKNTIFFKSAPHE